MMTTPGGTNSLGGVFGNPVTPGQTFDFADYVNVTPSPAQKAWNKTPGTISIKTPASVARRRIDMEGFAIPTGSPRMGRGLGMDLGGELLS
jgi:hypothetical protein